MKSDLLHVVAVVSNPVRYSSRYRLYKEFEKNILNSGAILWTVECAFGDRPFEVTSKDNHRHLQLRSYHELWHKENMINLGIQHMVHHEPNVEYIAWVDADVQFTNPNWVSDTVHELQHYMFVQMFSEAIDLGPDHQFIHKHKGYIYFYHEDQMKDVAGYGYYDKGHPGYCWAARREALDLVGGVIDFGILGSADRHMAGALIGQVKSTHHKGVHSNYSKWLNRWEHLAERYIKRDVGYLPGTIFHHWHGKKKDRGYKDRWNILVDNQFDPELHIVKDTQGLWQLTDHNIKLRDQIRYYFRQRNEDSIDTE